VIVRDGGETLLITGDLLHLPVQVAYPDRASSHDEDPFLGCASRRLTLWLAAAHGWRVAVNHFAEPWGQVDDGWRSDVG